MAIAFHVPPPPTPLDDVVARLGSLAPPRVVAALTGDRNLDAACLRDLADAAGPDVAANYLVQLLTSSGARPTVCSVSGGGAAVNDDAAAARTEAAREAWRVAMRARAAARDYGSLVTDLTVRERESDNSASFKIVSQQMSLGANAFMALITSCVIGYALGRHFIDVNNTAGVSVEIGGRGGWFGAFNHASPPLRSPVAAVDRGVCVWRRNAGGGGGAGDDGGGASGCSGEAGAGAGRQVRPYTGGPSGEGRGEGGDGGGW